MQARRRRRPSSLLIWLPLILIFICLIAGGLLLASSLLEDETEAGDCVEPCLKYGLTLKVSGFDPHLNQSAELGIPYYSVYDMLVYRHPQTRTYEPGLAASWEISPDRTTYTFRLKEGVTFHDGTPFNADAVGVNLDRITDPNFGSQRARSLLGPYYQGYAIVDQQTIQILLSQPYEPLLDGLSQVYLGIASPTAITNYRDGTYQFNQVGTGPYRVAEVVPGESILLERNPDYTWGPPFYTQNNPNPAAEIEFRFFEDEATRDDALQSGQVDVIGELPPIDAEILVGNNEIRVYPVPIPGQPIQFLFNTRQAPTNVPQVRQALILATNRVGIVDAIFAGQGEAAFGPLTRVTDFYSAEVEAMYSYDIERALELLNGIGITDTDEDGVLEVSGEPMEIRVLLVSSWTLLPEIAQAMADQWEQIGIQVTIEQVPNFPQLLAAIDEGDWNLVAFYSYGVDPSILNDYYLTDARSNFGGYSNPEVDQWLMQAIQTANPEERRILYSNIQRAVMEDAVVLPIRDQLNLNAATAELDGIVYSANGWWPLLNNFQWSE